MLMQGLSNTDDKGGVTGMAEYNNNGELIPPTHADHGRRGRLRLRHRINPQELLLTSSFTGWNNYMMDARQAGGQTPRR